MRRIPRAGRVLVVVLVAVLAVSGCGKSSSSKARLSGVKTYSGLTHKHKLGHLTYPQTPPVGGDHAPAWLKCAVYTQQPPNETAVHSLEHGAVWITYQPDLAPADVAKLDKLDEINPDYMLVSPYAGQPSKVMATAWGLQLGVDSADDSRLAAFAKAYAGGGQGGEPGADCAQRGLSIEQSQQLINGG